MSLSTKYPAEPTVVCHLLPGTSHTALTKLMYQSFVVVHDELEGFGPSPRKGEDLAKIDVRTLTAAKLFLFRGHMNPSNFLLRDLYPEVLQDPRYFCFCFMSDPLRSAAMIFHYLVSHSTVEREWDFDRFVLEERPPNDASVALSCRWWNFRSRLRRYSFIGISERAEESLEELAAEIDRRYAEFPASKNALRVRFFLEKYRTQPFVAEPQPEVESYLSNVGSGTQKQFRKRNFLDYRLYDFARSLMDSRLARKGHK